MAGFVIRVKTKTGQKVVNGLSSNDTVLQLKKKLCELTDFKMNLLHVLSGFPPKTINLNNDNLTINDCGIVSGDTLIVEEKQQPINDIKINEPRSHIVDSEGFTDSTGILIKKIVPSDNSCLFTSVGYVLNGSIDSNCSGFMRELIANAVASDPEEYSEAILGKPNKSYCEWIMKPDSWGGGIEVSILSKFYGIEIVVVNSVSGIISRFGEDQHYSHRVFLIFDGIHYDPLYMEPFNGGSIQTLFPTNDERVLLEATQLAKEAKSSRQFTDVQNFTVKCMDCNIDLNGEKAATQHAKDTGHTNFDEVK